MSNIKEERYKPRLHVSVNLLAGVWLRSCATVAIAVVRKRPRAIPVAMITTRKSIHGFCFLSNMGMGVPLAELR